jgi:hypothetical protein
MQQRVMMTVQQDQVIEARLAALAPVVDMVSIHEARLATTGKAAALIAQDQSATDRRRDRAGLAAYVQYVSGGVFLHRHQRGVAGQASCGRGGQREMTAIAFK